MKVKLLTHTPDPEKIVASAAKLCYSPSDISTLMDNLTEEGINKFIDRLASMGHESPFELITFTFGIEDISRACSHQLVRHRIASYSQQSQRYVDGNTFEYVVPPAISEDEECAKLFNEVLLNQQKAYSEIRDALIVKYIKEFYNKELAGTTEEILTNFKCENKAMFSSFVKKANEDARYILPNACTTKIIVTANARSLFNFFKLRCCTRAQWEIREVACEMLRLVTEVAPLVFKNAGPSCVRGKCTEGEMSCGKPFKKSD